MKARQIFRLAPTVIAPVYAETMRTISVVIPAKNDAAMLENCLAALARQSRPADEIIVVDNASTDATAAVARRFGTVVLYEPQPGITAAASHGYDAAIGDIIARCDADSLVPTDWLERIERTMVEHPDAVAVTGPATFYDLTRLGDWLARVLYLGAYFFSAGAALAGIPLFGSNFAISASAWRRVRATVHRESATVHDDLDLSFQLLPGMAVVYDRELRMQISARPFDSLRSMAVRSWRGIATLGFNWSGWIHRRQLVVRAQSSPTRGIALARGSEASLP